MEWGKRRAMPIMIRAPPRPIFLYNLDMPLYDYVCLDCRQRFDVFMTYAEYGERPVICPHCQSGRVRVMEGMIQIGIP